MTVVDRLGPVPHFPDAACRRPGADPAWWFTTVPGGRPGPEATAARATINRAIAICRTCPHLDDCRTYAIAHEPHGVWGGMSEADRKEANGGGGACGDACGQPAGYNRHKRAGEASCAPCRDAWNTASNEYHRARRARLKAEGAVS